MRDIYDHSARMKRKNSFLSYWAVGFLIDERQYSTHDLTGRFVAYNNYMYVRIEFITAGLRSMTKVSIALKYSSIQKSCFIIQPDCPTRGSSKDYIRSI